jgi:hypothetical protein
VIRVSGVMLEIMVVDIIQLLLINLSVINIKVVREVMKTQSQIMKRLLLKLSQINGIKKKGELIMENQAEEYIKALQTTIATKQSELDGLSGWHYFKRRKLRKEINKGEQLLKPLLKQAQGIRQ